VSLYQWLIRPVLFQLDAELSHELALAVLKRNLVPSPAPLIDEALKTEAFGLTFQNPVGLAAGFDKNAIATKNLRRMGFGFIEVGTVTPRPQPGNPKPRLFRLREDQAIINRLGFNNLGLDAFVSRLEISKSETGYCPIGANIGKNKDTEDAVEDYVLGVRAVAEIADYIVVNVSSPNTPGLRDLQAKSHLEHLVAAVMEERESGSTRPPLLLKIAPDLSEQDIIDIADVANRFQIDGLIATNTTISRPDDLASDTKQETGGLSGAPLLDLSTDALQMLYRSTEGNIPIIGVGGIFSGADAYRKIRSGASLVQIYSAMIYKGPAVAAQVSKELAGLLSRDGFSNIAEAVGADAR